MDSNNILEEKTLEDYPKYVSMENTEIILEQMKKTICKIYMNDGSKGTGFFCKIPYPDKEHFLPTLITSNHLINKSKLENNDYIEFSINNDKIKKKINIKKKYRKIYTNGKYDTTIIEILEKEDDIKDFLEVDFDINDEDLNNIYAKRSIYILHYPNFEKVSVSYGIIKYIDLSNNYDINHFCSTEKGSSGSPILNISNNKIIGIHKGHINNINNNLNKGILLKYPIKDFINKIKNNKLIKKSSKEKFSMYNSVKNYLFKPSIEIQNQNSINFNLSKFINSILKRSLLVEGFQIYGLKDNELFGAMEGPPKTSYENGYFLFKMIIPLDYPYKPPKFYFLTKIFHPNIDEFGLVSVDILQDQWNTIISKFYTIIISIQSLLDDPNPDIFVNEQAAKLYKEDKIKYEETVRNFTLNYANYLIFEKDLAKLNLKINNK